MECSWTAHEQTKVNGKNAYDGPIFSLLQISADARTGEGRKMKFPREAKIFLFGYICGVTFMALAVMALK